VPDAALYGKAFKVKKTDSHSRRYLHKNAAPFRNTGNGAALFKRGYI